MEKIKWLIVEISALRISLRKASEATNRYTRQKYDNDVEYHYKRVLKLLEDEDVISQLDPMLSDLSGSATSKENIEITLKTLRSEKSQFITEEMRLAPSMKVSRNDVEKLVKVSEKFIRSTEHRDRLFPIPNDSAQFTKLFIKATEHTKALSKRYSGGSGKELKDQAKWQAKKHYNLFAMGIALSLGNMMLAAGSSGIAAPVAISSMAIGVLASGAAEFNDPEILKLISQALNSKGTKDQEEVEDE